MSSPPKRPPESGGKRERTRAALIAATLEIVEETGFAAASLDAIAARAGMTKGAVHQSCRRILKRASLFRENCVSAGFPLLRDNAKWFNPEDERSPLFHL